MTNDELLPCPFCDGKADLLELDGWIVHCRYCYAQTRQCSNWEEAEKAWNARNEKHNPFLEKK